MTQLLIAFFRILSLLLSVKSLQKSGQYIRCFELLQREFAEHPRQTSLMYIYGKYVVKAMASEVNRQMQQMMAGKVSSTNKKRNQKARDFRIDQGYLGSGIGALEECLRSCFDDRHAKVQFYIGFAYKILRMPLKTYENWSKAQKLNQANRTLSPYKSNQIKLFLNEYVLFKLM